MKSVVLALFLAAPAAALGGATTRTHTRISPLCRRLHGWDGVSQYDVLAPPTATLRRKAVVPTRPPLVARMPQPVKATLAILNPLQPAQSASARRHDPPLLLLTTARVPLLMRLVAMWVVAKLALLRLRSPPPRSRADGTLEAGASFCLEREC